MIKHQGVAGAKKGSYASTRPVMVCDTKDCPNKIEGNAGGDEDMVHSRANSLGWVRNTKTSKDLCPDCQTKAASAKPAAGKGK